MKPIRARPNSNRPTAAWRRVDAQGGAVWEPCATLLDPYPSTTGEPGVYAPGIVSAICPRVLVEPQRLSQNDRGSKASTDKALRLRKQEPLAAPKQSWERGMARVPQGLDALRSPHAAAGLPSPGKPLITALPLPSGGSRGVDGRAACSTKRNTVPRSARTARSCWSRSMRRSLKVVEAVARRPQAATLLPPASPAPTAVLRNSDLLGAARFRSLLGGGVECWKAWRPAPPFSRLAAGVGVGEELAGVNARLVHLAGTSACRDPSEVLAYRLDGPYLRPAGHSIGLSPTGLANGSGCHSR